VTQAKPERAERGQLSEEAEAAAALATELHEQRLHHVGEMAPDMVHDFRNALAAIIYNVEALKLDTEQLDPEQRDCLREIASSTKRLDSMVTALLDYAAPDPNVVEEIDLESAFGRIAALLRGRLRATGNLLRTSVTSGAQACLGNARAVEQVLVGLINSLLSGPVGGAAGRVTINVETLCDETAGQVGIRICDDSAVAVERVPTTDVKLRLRPLANALVVARRALEPMGGSVASDGDDIIVYLPAIRHL
jgi:signal transduction histidine kinase